MREATCCSGQWLRQRLTLVKVLRISNCRVLNPKQDIYFTPPTQISGVNWKEGQKDYKSQS